MLWVGTVGLERLNMPVSLLYKVQSIIVGEICMYSIMGWRYSKLVCLCCLN